MSTLEDSLIIIFTTISIIVTIKSVSTAIIELIRLGYWVIEKIRDGYYLIFPGSLQTSKKFSIKWLFEKSKTTLLPFIDRNYYKKIRKKRFIGVSYFIVFLFSFFLILTFFWAFLTADLSYVLDNSPYLIDSIENLIITFQNLSKVVSFLFIFGFIVEVINSIRTLF